MQERKMREAFEKWAAAVDCPCRATAWKARQAAYAAGMERAAEIAQFEANGWMRTKGGGERHEEAQTISDAIRAEITKGAEHG